MVTVNCFSVILAGHTGVSMRLNNLNRVEDGLVVRSGCCYGKDNAAETRVEDLKPGYELYRRVRRLRTAPR